jgi:hypothetical protein
VIDSNAIVADFWLRSKRWQLLIRGATEGQFALHVPQPVVDEVTKQFELGATDARASISKAGRLAGRYFPGHAIADPVDLPVEVGRYVAHLRSTLEDAGATFDVPTVELATITEAAVARRKPFKQNGSGLIDMIVWLRTKELAASSDVALISDNYRDFGGSKQGGLHEELTGELTNKDSITRYPSPAEFLADNLDHADIYAGDIRALLDDLAYSQELYDAFLMTLDSKEARSLGAWGSAAGADDTFFEAGDITSVQLIEVTDAGADSGYVALEVHGTGTYEFPVFASEAFEAREDGVLDHLALDSEWIGGEASRTVRMTLQVDAIYNPDTGYLGEFEVTSADLE